MKLGTYLKHCRDNKGLSQSQVAEKMKWGTAQLVSNNERGISKPPLGSVKKLCEVIGADVKIVFKLMFKQDVARIKRKYVQYF